MAYNILMNTVITLLLSQLAVSQHLDHWSFNRPPQWVECDYGAQKGYTCVSCSELLQCGRTGGVLVLCPLLKPHCNNNTCASEPAPDCT